MTAQPLRHYQVDAIRAARELYRARRARGEARSNVLLVAPTGAGKTRIGVELVTSALSRPGADGVIWMAHRVELLKQARSRLLAEGLGDDDVDILAPGFKRSPGARVHVASVQTLASTLRRDGELPAARVVVLDEAHHYAADEWSEVAGRYAGSTILGLTATPERSDGRALGDLFDELIPVSSVRQLQAMGVLVPSIVYAPEHGSTTLSDDPVDAYRARCPGERGFVFCATVDHAQLVADGFTEAGYPASVIHADTPAPLRAALLKAFATGDDDDLRRLGVKQKTPVLLCNVFALTEGVDVPAASVCILARGASHPGTYLQMVGRVLRAAPGKERAVILDLKGISLQRGFGTPETDRVYSLEGKPIRIDERDAEAKPTSCSACGCVFAKWRVDGEGRRICPECKAPGKLMPEAAKVEKKELRAIGPLASDDAKTWRVEQLIATAQHHQRKPGWVWHQYKALFGTNMPASLWRSVKARVGEVAA